MLGIHTTTITRETEMPGKKRIGVNPTGLGVRDQHFGWKGGSWVSMKYNSILYNVQEYEMNTLPKWVLFINIQICIY